MLQVANRRIPCLNLTANPDLNVIDWSGDRNSSWDIIDMNALPLLRHLFNHKLNDTFHQWCGPMLYIAEYFAKFTRTRTRFYAYESLEDMNIKSMEQIDKFGLEGIPHYSMLATTPSSHCRAIAKFGRMYQDASRLSTYFNYFQSAHILAGTRKGHKTIFDFFDSFEPEVYYSLIASLVIISVTMTLITRNYWTILNNLWIYTSALLSKSVSLPSDTTVKRLLSGLWLISCTVILAAFAGILRDQLIRPQGIEWIDSLTDLFNWNQVVIQAYESDYLDDFVNEFPDDPMAINFKQRLKLLDYSNSFSKNASCYLDFEGVVKGRTAVVADLEFLTIQKNVLVQKFDYQDNFDFHVSSMEEISTPGFIGSNRFRLEDSLANVLDLV